MGYTKLAVRLWPNGMFRTVQKSAGDVQNAALNLEDPDLGEYPKGSYLNGSERAESSVESKDQTKQNELWELSFKYTNLDEKETVLGQAISQL